MPRYTVVLLLLCLLPGCNFFSWAASVDDSNDYDLLVAEARAHMSAGSPEKAVDYFSRALEIRTNDIQALDGRVEARLLILTDGRSVYTAFPRLFATNGSASENLFTDQPPRLGLLLATSLAAAHDATVLDSLFSHTNTARTARLTADAAVANGLTALLLAADGNTNGIPGEAGDPVQPGADFGIRLNTSGFAQAFIDTARGHAQAAVLWLDRLAMAAPLSMATGTPLSAFRRSLVRFASNLAEVRP